LVSIVCSRTEATNSFFFLSNAIVNNDYSYSRRIELAFKCMFHLSEVEDTNKEHERNIPCSCSPTVTKESIEDTHTRFISLRYFRY
jgi:hypothetical protein